MGAIAEGRYDALLGAIPGMLVGAALYAEAYTYLKDGLLKTWSFGKVTIPQMLGWSSPYHWIVVLFVCGGIILFLRALEKRGL
jgi:hypothetical protein